MMDGFVTVAEAVALLRVNRSSLWEARKSGKIPSYQIAGMRSIRLKLSDLVHLVPPDQMEASRFSPNKLGPRKRNSS